MIVAQFAPFLVGVKIAAALGGAMAGYLLSGPLWRLLYRAAFQRPIPGWVLPLGRIAGGAGLGALLFFLVSLGGGDGWGLFGGAPGVGGGSGPGKAAKNATDKSALANPDASARAKLEIELLGGKSMTGEGRYYLVRRAPPAKTLAEVEDILKDDADKWEVHLVMTDDSVFSGHSAVTKLRELLQRYRIPAVTPREAKP